MSRTTLLLALLAAVAASLLLVPSAFAAGPITQTSGNVQFSPNGDGQEDTVTWRYCVGTPAEVTTVILPEGSSTPVRTLETDRHRDNGCWAVSWVWDGRNDGGNPVPDGRYVIRVSAVASVGDPATYTEEDILKVQRINPGFLSKPVGGADINGAFDVEMTPNATFPDTITKWEGTVPGCSVPSATAPGGDGRWHIAANSHNCSAGAQTVGGKITFKDEFNATHFYTPPTAAVTLRKPVTINDVSDPEQFSPNGDGFEDTGTVRYCLNTAADVTTTIVPKGQTNVVRTFETAQRRNAGCWTQSWTWDGKDDSGQALPDGKYTVRVHAIGIWDPAPADNATELKLSRATPGAMVRPVAGDNVAGVYDFRFQPDTAFPDTITGWQAKLANCTSATTTAVGDDGLWHVSINSAGCTAGSQQASGLVRFKDEYNDDHWHPLPAVTVNVIKPVQITNVTGNHQFSPNGDAQEDVANIRYCLSTAADVTTTITPLGGTTPVRTLETSVRRNASCYAKEWTWDGLDDAGDPVGEGKYTVKIRAIGAMGDATPDEETLTVKVDRDVAGAITSPTAGSGLSGTVDVQLTPGGGFDGTITQFQASASNCTGTATSAIGGDGKWHSSVNTNNCTASATKLDGIVTWKDEFNSSHTYRTSVNVTFGPPVRISSISDPVEFSPNSDSQEDTATFTYCLSIPADVTTTIVPQGSSTPVRTLETSARRNGCHAKSWTWDGRNDAAEDVADGRYVAIIRAIAASGDQTPAEATVQLQVDRRIPGALVSPAAGSNLVGQTDVQFAPTSGFHALKTFKALATGCEGAQVGSPSGDGKWHSQLDAASSACTAGPSMLRGRVTYNDVFGDQHTYDTPGIPVTVRGAVEPERDEIVASGSIPKNTFGIDASSEPNGDGATGTIWFQDTTKPAYRIEGDVVCMRIEGDRATIVYEDTLTPPGAAGTVGGIIRLRDSSTDAQVNGRLKARDIAQYEALGCPSSLGVTLRALAGGSITITDV